MGRIATYSLINCAVNPQAARERVMAYEPILQKKKVLVVGGGVAELENQVVVQKDSAGNLCVSDIKGQNHSSSSSGFSCSTSSISGALWQNQLTQPLVLAQKEC